MKRIISIIFVFLLALLGLYYFYANSGQPQAASDKKLMVVCTTTLIADALREIAGDLVTIHTLMGPGVDPHTYHAKESDVLKLADADLILYHGLHLEGKMGHIFARMARYRPTHAVGELVDRQQLRTTEFEGSYDPHIWFDVQLWKQVVIGMKKLMHDADKKNTLIYEQNCAKYLASLDQLETYIHERVQSVPVYKRVLVTAHDAFAYFGKAYGFTVIGLQGLSTDAEVGTTDLMRLVDIIIDHKVPAIFTENSIPKRSIEAVQQAVSVRGNMVTIGPELYADSLGSVDSQGSTYCAMVRYNVDSIINSLTPCV